MLANYRATFGEGVAEIAEARSSDAAALAAAVAHTNAALASDADVIYQAAFATDEFVGFADFLVRDESGRWIVQDSKLARRARVTALMQLSAYVDQLDRLGVPRSDRVELLLGDGTTSVHLAEDLLPVFGEVHARCAVTEEKLDPSERGTPRRSSWSTYANSCMRAVTRARGASYCLARSTGRTRPGPESRRSPRTHRWRTRPGR